MYIVNHFKKKSNIQILKFLSLFLLLNSLILGIVYFLKTINIDLSSIAQYQKNIIFIYIQIFVFIIPLKLLKVKKEDLQLKSIKLLKTLIVCLKGYLMFIGINVVISLTNLNQIIPGLQTQENLIPELAKTNLELTIIGIAICLVAPIVEEIVFRGYIYSQFKKNYSIIQSSILTSIIFSALHFQFQVFTAMLILSLIIHYVREKSHSTCGAIIFHVINNTITFFVLISL